MKGIIIGMLITALLSACSPARHEAEMVAAAAPAPGAYAQKAVGLRTMAPAAMPMGMPQAPVQDREEYAHLESNPVKRVLEEPVSTFSIDVDSGAYANVRRFINQGSLPRKDAVRAEELINYFDYHYPQEARGSDPFSLYTELGPTPWNPHTRLLHIGIQGEKPDVNDLPPANLVFLVDVSGSMDAPEKLGLLKSSLKMLVRQMDEKDRVSIAVYAGAAGVVLEPTPGNQRAKIMAALDRLRAGGSTNGGEGIRLAYNLAEQGFIKNGINRVLIATDGDFNVGTVNFEALIDLIEEKRASGIALTTLGFGMYNYNDRLMEQLADHGNGQYAYIDTINEARKVLVDELASTLKIIAKDVKIQIEFNPAVVAEYRLIGYENRMLKREDFNNDKVDAGEIGAGHSVTALYEIALVGSQGLSMEPLRYQSEATPNSTAGKNELAFLRLRYKQPDGDRSTLIEHPITNDAMVTNLAKCSERFRFSAAVAAYADLLRGGNYSRDFGYQDVIKLAIGARGNDAFSYRSDFVSLVRNTLAIAPKAAGSPDSHHGSQ